MTVLVTGGAGYIGSHTVLELLDQGEAVIVIDDLSTGFSWAVPERATFIPGDVADGELVSRIIADHGVSSVVHFAARIVVPESVSDPLSYYYANTVKTRALLEAVLRSGVTQFIFSSTAAVYGEPEHSPVSETARPEPINPYGRSKLMTEWMLSDVARAHDLTYVTLRYFNVAGADPRGRSGQSSALATHLIKIAALAALGQRESLSIFGTDYPTPDGTCIRDYIHVSDLARAHVAALQHLRAGGQSLTLNCGYGKGFSVRQVVDVVKRISGVDFPVVLSPRRAGDPAELVANVSAIGEQLMWKPKYCDLSDMVRNALDWERNLAARRQPPILPAEKT